MPDDLPEILVLKFADSAIPKFKEIKNGGYVEYGEGNKYASYLTYLYNKSGKHNAIINGKCNYIGGSGIKRRSDLSVEEGSKVINRTGETLKELTEKQDKDIEIYGGYRMLVIWANDRKQFERFHLEYERVRTGIKQKDQPQKFYYLKDWAAKSATNEPTPYYEFNEGVWDAETNPTARTGSQVFAYNEYRPGCDVYPLPGYVGSCNYIETDIEISKFHLSGIRNGMAPSKMIQFFSGEPSEDKKKEIEKRFRAKFGGSENAGNFVLVFGNDANKSVKIDDLSGGEIDKMFDILGKTVQQEIFTGHEVTSGMLFGIKTEGQLGGSSELKTAYEIFINTYAKPKQTRKLSILNKFDKLSGGAGDLYIEQLDPIGLQIDIASIKDILPKEFFFEQLNIDKKYWPAPTAPAPGTEPQQTSTATNTALTNLTGRQYQQVMRILREYMKPDGGMNEAQARVMLKGGFGFTDEDVDSFLGIERDPAQAAQMAADEKDELAIQLFSECGESKDDYETISTKKVLFSSDHEAFDDEIKFYQSFKDTVTDLDSRILDLIRGDKRITPEIIAKALKTSPENVIARISSLTESGWLESKIERVGEDEQIERKVTAPPKATEPPKQTRQPRSVQIKYSYEGPQDSRNRPFCAKLMQLNRLWTRTEIESISQRLGYSVFDRCGGWYTNPKTGETRPKCRHNFRSNVVIKKK